MLNTKIKRFLAVLCCIVMVLSLAACGNKDNTVYDDYSVGLTEDGYYENLEKYTQNAVAFNDVQFTVDEMLQYGLEIANSEETAFADVNAYVRAYGDEVLAMFDLANREGAACDGDVVNASLTFTVDGLLLEDYTSTDNYKLGSDSDDIVRSMYGKSVGDKYDTEFTFPEDDQYHPSKTAVVNVTINDILMGNPIDAGCVEKHLEEIQKYFPEVTDSATFIEAMKPRLAYVLMLSYVEQYVQELVVVVPDEFVEHEIYRLKARISQLGISYKEYLKQTNATDADVRDYCEMIARENYVLMLFAQSNDINVTEEECKEYFGDNYEYALEVQGPAYLKLYILREKAYAKISETVSLMYNGERVDISQYEIEIEEDLGDGEEVDPIEDQNTEVDTTTPN